MNIWLIQIGEPLPLAITTKKMRTAILADKLAKRGHSVTWWTSAFDHFQKKWIFEKDSELQLKENLRIMALKGAGYKKNNSLSRLLDHRIIAQKFRNLARENPKPDLIVASMPTHDLTYEAVKFANENKTPVIVDIRDPWPDIFLDAVAPLLKPAARLILQHDFNMTRKTMENADALTAVSDSFLRWGLKYAGREKTGDDRVYYLGYKKPESQNGLDEAANKFSVSMKALNGKFIVFFMGTMSRSYHNPLIILKTAENMVKYNDIHFMIAGAGELFEEMRAKAGKLSNVTLTGWLNSAEIEFWLKHSNVGVCPATKPVDVTTNKAYAYLSAGLPVISAFGGELRELIEKHQIGYYYPPNDANALAERIIPLYKDKELFRRVSDNARKTYNELFNADTIYEDYTLYIEKLFAGYKKGNA